MQQSKVFRNTNEIFPIFIKPVFAIHIDIQSLDFRSYMKHELIDQRRKAC